jgi:molecular chaperone Hsp33
MFSNIHVQSDVILGKVQTFLADESRIAALVHARSLYNEPCIHGDNRTMMNQDSFQRFLFEDIGVRGELVRLEASWQTVLERHPYPYAVRTQLGEALAAALLLSATIKFQGSLILQAQGKGPLQAVVAQATHHRAIRGIARWNGEVPPGPLAGMYGSGHLALTIQNEGAEPYQGIVALEGDSLAGALEGYFAHSEQLETRLWLVTGTERVAGLLLQELPSHQCGREGFERVAMLADTVRDGELLALPNDELLFRLFNEEKVRLFEAEPVYFRCSCSRSRIEQVLTALGQTEVQSILNEQGSVEVDCEFCNRHYSFDRIDIEALFADVVRIQGSTTRH